MSKNIEDSTLEDRTSLESVVPLSHGEGLTPVGGWLRAVRKARGVSQQQLAEKLGFKRQAWAQLEASEAREAISLYSLRRAADALGCDMVYYLVPRDDNTGAVGDLSRLQAGVAPEEHTEPDAPWPGQELPTELR